jgi:hypothetical protein
MLLGKAYQTAASAEQGAAESTVSLELSDFLHGLQLHTHGSTLGTWAPPTMAVGGERPQIH